ncbi:MAG: 30S ribosomal protein S20 [Deltaproteobacteria bacterium]|nr:30S ribosomal protein S20 [Deltaproteobacteria bacterium]
MATHKSAEKRARQNEKRRLRNKAVQTGIKGGVKSVRQAIEAKNPEAAAQALTQVAPAIDKAASKGVIHRKTASRKVSRLTKAVAGLSDQS